MSGWCRDQIGDAVRSCRRRGSGCMPDPSFLQLPSIGLDARLSVDEAWPGTKKRRTTGSGRAAKANWWWPWTVLLTGGTSGPGHRQVFIADVEDHLMAADRRTLLGAIGPLASAVAVGGTAPVLAQPPPPGESASGRSGAAR